jgi:hypothetical protein
LQDPPSWTTIIAEIIVLAALARHSLPREHAMAKQPPADPPPPNPPFSFTPKEAMEFMQRMWNPFGVPIPAFGVPGATTAEGRPTDPSGAGASTPPAGFPYPNPASMFMSLDPAEIERKIGELKVIEGWLTMSLNLMQMSVRTLELQKASLEALRGSAASSAEGGRGKG